MKQQQIPTDIDQLAADLWPDGEVLLPGTAPYDEASGALFAVGSPDVIVRPRDAAETSAAIRHATATGLDVTVRSGGHSVAGLSTHSHGMVIDLRRINHIEVLDERTRLVRIGAGATWGEVAAALRPHGWGITAGDTSGVGVGGLTLGGGIGWLVREYGLAIDSVVAAEVVLADGRIVRADATEHAELFWALRGGGGNSGVVTTVEFHAQPITTVQFGTIGYRIDDVPALVRGWRDVMRSADDRLNSTLVLAPAMMGGPAMLMVMCCYDGPAGASASAAIEPLRGIGEVLSDTVATTEYAEVLEPGPPAGMRMAMRNAMLPEFSDAAVDAVAEAFGAGRMMITVRSLGGAVARVAPNATAYAHRGAEVMLVAMTMLPPGAESSAIARMAEQLHADWEPLAGYGDGAYGNFLSSVTPTDTALVYPPNTYRRIAAVKRRYDPRNLFRRNHNVSPEVLWDAELPDDAGAA